jgi:hypothetical protein
MVIIALILVLAGLVCGHAAAWYWLSGIMERPFAALVLTGADLLLAVVFILIAAQSKPGRVEREAREVRQQVMTTAMQTMTLSAVVSRLGARLLWSRSHVARRP